MSGPMLEMQKRGAVAFDYGNNIRQVAKDEGVENAFDFPGFVPAYIRPRSAKGKARSAGWPSPETPRTFTRRTR